MVALRTLCSAAKNSDTCFDLEVVRAVGASVFRQLFAQLSSEVAHFTHPYYFEATSCSTFYPSCILRAFLGLDRELLSVLGRCVTTAPPNRFKVLSVAGLLPLLFPHALSHTPRRGDRGKINYLTRLVGGAGGKELSVVESERWL